MKTILVVEDDRSLARLAQLNLDAEGYNVVIHNEGAGALASLQHSTPDLVMLDLRLPTAVSGWDLLAYLRQDDRLCSVPVLVVSAFAHEEERKRAREAGANEYIVKPFGIAELLASVRRWVVATDET